MDELALVVAHLVALRAGPSALAALVECFLAHGRRELAATVTRWRVETRPTR